ncbi:hypothetical protein GGF32_010035 [Allomyces javanicus]|nr:hypothetical protein GGF32_010035 [Allomyces javanicus]
MQSETAPASRSGPAGNLQPVSEVAAAPATVSPPGTNVDPPELAEARILFRLHCRHRLRDAIWRVVVQVPPHIEELLEDMEVEFLAKQAQAEAQRLQQQETGHLLESDAIVEAESLPDGQVAELGVAQVASSDVARGSSRLAASAAET